MGIESTNAVDAVGIDDESDESDETVLSILDSHDWNDEGEHLYLLQEKLNAYLGFIESGEIATAYPDSVGHQCRIDLILRCAPTPAATVFFDQVARITRQYDVGFHWEIISD